MKKERVAKVSGHGKEAVENRLDALVKARIKVLDEIHALRGPLRTAIESDKKARAALERLHKMHVPLKKTWQAYVKGERSRAEAALAMADYKREFDENIRSALAAAYAANQSLEIPATKLSAMIAGKPLKSDSVHLVANDLGISTILGHQETATRRDALEDPPPLPPFEVTLSGTFPVTSAVESAAGGRLPAHRSPTASQSGNLSFDMTAGGLFGVGGGAACRASVGDFVPIPQNYTEVSVSVGFSGGVTLFADAVGTVAGAGADFFITCDRSGQGPDPGWTSDPTVGTAWFEPQQYSEVVGSVVTPIWGYAVSSIPIAAILTTTFALNQAESKPALIMAGLSGHAESSWGGISGWSYVDAILDVAWIRVIAT
jgi:hypothetical protein